MKIPGGGPPTERERGAFRPPPLLSLSLSLSLYISLSFFLLFLSLSLSIGRPPFMLCVLTGLLKDPTCLTERGRVDVAGSRALCCSTGNHFLWLLLWPNATLRGQDHSSSHASHASCCSSSATASHTTCCSHTWSWRLLISLPFLFL